MFTMPHLQMTIPDHKQSENPKYQLAPKVLAVVQKESVHC